MGGVRERGVEVIPSRVGSDEEVTGIVRGISRNREEVIAVTVKDRQVGLKG